MSGIYNYSSVRKNKLTWLNDKCKNYITSEKTYSVIKEHTSFERVTRSKVPSVTFLPICHSGLCTSM